MIRKFIASQVQLCRAIDSKILPSKFRADGYTDFVGEIVPHYLQPGMTVYDVGGGKTPCVSLEVKQALNLHVHGVDIDSEELSLAPEGYYDDIHVADICAFNGDCDADLVICRTVLEHVRHQESAWRGLETMLKPGGKLCIFVPCRNAIFARLNLLMPETVKVKLLNSIWPDSQGIAGFPAHYDRCTPRDFQVIGKKFGLKMLELRCYFNGKYFFILLPSYLLWRAWIGISYLLSRNQAAETFIMVLQKK